MKIDTQVHGLVTVIAPHGPLTHDVTTNVRDTLEKARSERGNRMVVDLKDVPYLDSAGIELLSDLFTDPGSRGLRPKLARLSEACREALDLTDVLPQLEVFDTLENAIRSFHR